MGWDGGIDVRSLYLDRTGVLWFGGKRTALHSLDLSNCTVRKYASINGGPDFSRIVVLSMCGDDDGNLWLGTNNAGLIHTDGGSGVFHSETRRSTLPDEADLPIVNLMRDRSGLVWISSDGDGVRVVNPHPPKFRSIDQLAGRFIKSIVQDHDGMIWIGTFEQGLYRYDPRTKEVARFRNPNGFAPGSANTVFAVYEDSRRRCWIGTAEGLKMFDRRLGTFRDCVRRSGSAALVLPHVYAIAEKSDGTLLTATSGGLFVFDPVGGKFTAQYSRESNPEILDNRMTCLYTDSHGTVWIGTHGGGILRVDSSGHWLRPIVNDATDSSSISSNLITGIFPDSRGFLWVSTASGLNRSMPGSVGFARYTTRQGLPSDYCYSALEDSSGVVWVSTNRGIAAVSVGKDGLSSPSVRSYDISDGLQSNEFNSQSYLRANDGTLYFGGINGVNIFSSHTLYMNPVPPRVAITGFMKHDRGDWQQLGRFLDSDSSIVLNYDDASFSFRFAAMEYTNVVNNKYAVKMEGFDSSWISLGTRRDIRFTRLDPGRYVFRVKACNGDGVWNEPGASVRITVIPPWWMRWEFKAATLLLLAGISGGVVLVYERRKQRRKLDELNRVHMLELERSRISRDMHDEVGSSLTKIALLSELSQSSIRDEREVVRNLGKISGLSREVIENIGQIVWAINPKHDSMQDLSSYIRAYIFDSFDPTPIRVHADFPETPYPHMLSAQFRRNIFLVVKEAVHNILKHSRATEVFVEMGITEELLELSVRDNGAGFDESVVRREGNGLGNMRQRIEELGGECTITSNSGRGTTISLRARITTNV
jgi:signal transduction histidine kinase/ligand-binding sensor domain-containing protein